MSELETREFEIRAEEDGFIEGIAVPYGQVYNAGSFRERFERGAFEGSDAVKLYFGHKEIIGHVTASEDREEGFWIRAKIAATTLGNDVLALLRNGSLDKLSVGFVPVTHRNEAGVIVRTKAQLREVSVVERPAYSLANILAVREDQSDPTVPKTKESPVENTETPGLVEVREEVQELSRRFDSFTPITAEPADTADHRSAGAFVKALASGETAATESYNRALEHKHDEVLHRAYTGGTTADAPIKDAWVGDLTRLFDASSGVLSQLFSTGTLPATGMNIEYAQLLSNSVQVTEQVAQGNDLAYGKITLETKTAPVKTYGGFVQLTRQQIERSSLPVLNRSLEALAIAAGARKKVVLRAAVEAAVTAREAIALNGGVVLLGATLAAGVAGNWEDALIDAAIRYDSENSAPDALVVSASVFKKLRSLTVSGERVFAVSNGNASGTLNLPGLTGNLAGLPVYLDAGQAGDRAYFVNGRAIRQYDSAIVSLQDENIINLSKDFSVYRYGATALEIPQLIVPVKLAAA